MEEIKCPACWNDIPKESVNCPQCGFLLKSPQQSIPTNYTEIKEKENSIYPNYSSVNKNSVDINKKNKTIITVAVVLVALIFIVGISSWGKNQNMMIMTIIQIIADIQIIIHPIMQLLEKKGH